MKEQFSCQETKSLWGRRLLQSVPITLSLFVAIGSGQRKNLRASLFRHKF